MDTRALPPSTRTSISTGSADAGRRNDPTQLPFAARAFPQEAAAPMTRATQHHLTGEASTGAFAEGFADFVGPCEVVLGATDRGDEQVPVVPVVAAVRVRGLDLAIERETRLCVRPKLRHVLEQDVRRRELADEELEKEGLARSGLDLLEPSAQGVLTCRRDAVELPLPIDPQLAEARLREPRQRGEEAAAGGRPDVSDRALDELREVVRRPLALRREECEH